MLKEAAATCLELHAAGPTAVTEWLAARLGPVAAFVELHSRLATAPAPEPLTEGT